MTKLEATLVAALMCTTALLTFALVPAVTPGYKTQVTYPITYAPGETLLPEVACNGRVS